MKKRAASLLLCLVLLCLLLPAAALAADTLDVAMADCTRIGSYTDEEYPVYYYAPEEAGTASSVRFPDFSGSMGPESMIASVCGNAYVSAADTAPISDDYLAGDWAERSDSDWTPAAGWETLDFTGCHVYWLMDDHYDTYYFVLRLPDEPAPAYPFASAAGTVSRVTENGYAYDTDWDGKPDARADLYTVSVPFGTQADTLTFSEARIAYCYDADGVYLSSCAADAQAGYADNGQTGETAACVRLTQAGALPARVVVQTPYTAEWKSDTLYAVQYEYTHTFTVKVDGLVMTGVTASPNAYRYYDSYHQTTTTVMVYTVAVPQGTKTAELYTGDNVLLYNYDADGNYLAGWYTGEAMYTGGTVATVTLDSNGDGKTDFVQVQTPYDTAWNSTLLYAVTFDDGTSGGTTPAGPTGNATVDGLLTGISAANTENAGQWWITDMAAYAAAFPDAAAKTTAAARQAAVNRAIDAAGKHGASDTDCAMAILALTASGADPEKLYRVNSNTPFSAVEALSAAAHSESPWSAPYTLMAYHQGDYAGTEDYEAALVRALLDSQQADGSWEEYGTVDTTANVLAGLAFYAGDAEVDAAIEKAVAYLSGQMRPDGTFDGGYGANANSTAMVIVGLAAAGVDPATDARFVHNGVSALDGLLSFALADHSGFGYQSSASYNDSATEQGFRALIAAAQVRRTGAAYNVYDFSANAVSPAHATGSGSTQSPEPSTGDTITVTVTVKATDGYWLNHNKVTLPGDGATVYHAFVKALERAGMTQTGAEDGYVRSITKNGVTLAEFGGGENSGWLYKVNGKLPDVGLTEYDLSDGDRILWYYTVDWTRDPDAGKYAEPEITPVTPPVPEQPALPFADVPANAWYAAPVEAVWRAGWMNGTDGTTFAPSGTLSRAMLVTILHRLAGADTPAATAFPDVPSGAWYAGAAAWAAKTGVVTGYADGRFGPDDPVTREQIAAMLRRCAAGLGCDVSKRAPLTGFADAAAVSPWAQESVQRAVGSGIIGGADGGRLLPGGYATRAEAAAMLQRFAEKVLPTAGTAAQPSAAEAALQRAAAAVLAAAPTPVPGSIGGDWAVLGLARAGADVPAGYYADYYDAVAAHVRDCQGVLHERKYTEYSRTILALSAIGCDARDVAGYDLTLPLGDYEKTVRQGINGPVWALLALDSRDYPMPQDPQAKTQATRQRYVDCILAAQREDGGWSMTDGPSDPDMTAMALQALARYQAQENVGAAVRRGLACLSALQASDGGFASQGTPGAESCAQVLVALGELGVPADDARFVKPGGSVLDALLRYQLADGGFCHTAGGERNEMASEQALYALAAQQRAANGEDSLYRMSGAPALCACPAAAA